MLKLRNNILTTFDMTDIIISRVINVRRGAMSKYFDNATIFKAFCDENRLTILELLSTGEKCACVLLEKLTVGQPTLSHHMKILVESGMVKARKEGKWMHYSIDAAGCEKAAALFKKFTVILETKTEGCCT
jgi:ArsR family transcriptional regulator